MMNNKLEAQFYKTIMEGVANYVKRNTPSYINAKVINIDDTGTPFVKFSGAETTTPVTSVTNVAKGDEVLVQVNQNGDAYIYGNLTSQPVSKVEIDKTTEQTNLMFKQFNYSLSEIIAELDGSFVKVGSSGIGTLSSNMAVDLRGVNIYNSGLPVNSNYIRLSFHGMDIDTVISSGELNSSETPNKQLIAGQYPHIHIGNDYLFYGQVWDSSAAFGERAVLIGRGRATGKMAVAIGNTACAGGNYSVALNAGYADPGSGSTTYSYNFAANEGNARRSYATAVNKAYADGESSFAAGSSGNFTNGVFAACFGDCVNANGKASFAEGYGFYPSNNTATAPGTATNKKIIAGGIASYAGGYQTQTFGNYAYARGMMLLAQYLGQTVVGISNDNKDDTVFEVGNGEVTFRQTYNGYPLYRQDSQSNGFEVTRDGYIRTGHGMEKIGFGKSNGIYGYFTPDVDEEEEPIEVFTPWVPLVNGLIPSQYLPSYVDDVIEGYYNETDHKFYEDSSYTTEIVGERGKIYVSIDTDICYRWSGTVFVEITSGGVVYSAGTGIDISATNEISVDFTDFGDLSQIDIDGSTSTKFLKGDGTWDTPDNTTYTASGSVEIDANNDIRLKGTVGGGYQLIYLDGTDHTLKLSNKNVGGGANNIPVCLSNGTITMISGPIGLLYGGTGAANAADAKTNLGIVDPVQSDWNQTDNTALDYIKNKPSIPSGQVQSDWNQTDNTEVDYIKNKPTIPAAQIQSDWNQTDTAALDYIKNKPTIPTNTDEKVKQQNTAVNSDYRVLFSYSVSDNTLTEGARKSNTLKFNPSTGNLQTIKLNGVTVGSSPKFTDTTYTAGAGINISSSNVISATGGITFPLEVNEVDSGINIKHGWLNIDTKQKNHGSNEKYGVYFGTDSPDTAKFRLWGGTNFLRLACIENGNIANPKASITMTDDCINMRVTDEMRLSGRIDHFGEFDNEGDLIIRNSNWQSMVRLSNSPSCGIRTYSGIEIHSSVRDSESSYKNNLYVLDDRQGVDIYSSGDTTLNLRSDVSNTKMGGRLHLHANENNPNGYPDILLDAYEGALRIYKSGSSGNNIIKISPTDKSITGGYSFDGTINGLINGAVVDSNFASSFRTETYPTGTYEYGNYIQAIRCQSAGSTTGLISYSSGIAFGYYDTQGYIMTGYNSAKAYIGGGNGNALNWIKEIAFADTSVQKSGDTMTDHLTLYGSFEIYPQSSSAGHGGYIDFHYNQGGTDYTSRIIEDQSGRLTVNNYSHFFNDTRYGGYFQGNVTIDCNSINFNNGLRINSPNGTPNGWAGVWVGTQGGYLYNWSSSYPTYYMGKVGDTYYGATAGDFTILVQPSDGSRARPVFKVAKEYYPRSILPYIGSSYTVSSGNFFAVCPTSELDDTGRALLVFCRSTSSTYYSLTLITYHGGTRQKTTILSSGTSNLSNSTYTYSNVVYETLGCSSGTNIITPIMIGC